MKCIVNIIATFEQARYGTIASANIARACFHSLRGEKNNQESQFVNAVELAVGEACTNSVKHQILDEKVAGPVKITFQLGKNVLLISVGDRNPPFAFDQSVPPDVYSLAENGYGIHIMKESMDRVNYRHTQGWNIITMIKKIPQEDRL